MNSLLRNSLSLKNLAMRQVRKPLLNLARGFAGNIQGNVVGIDLGTTNSCVAVMEVYS